MVVGGYTARMATFVMIPGAGGAAWYWSRVAPLLRAAEHEVIAVDLPADDPKAGIVQYAELVAGVIGTRKDVVLVAQSLGGFTAPLVCERVPVQLLVLVAAMVPAPGESGAQWWVNTGYADAKREQDERDGRPPDAGLDLMTAFFNDVPPEVVEEAFARGELPQSDAPFKHPWPLDAWPDVPTKFLLCREDRFFPAEFMRRVVPARLGIVPDEMDSGHLPALAHPDELVERLEAYRVATVPG